MQTNLVIVSKNKLLGVDGVMPIVMELRALYPNLSIIFVLISDSHAGVIQKNYHLWEAIQSVKGQVFVLRTNNPILKVIRFLRFFIMLLFKRNIFLKDVDALPKHRLFIKILRKFSKVVEIKTYLVVSSTIFHKIYFSEKTLLREREGRKISDYNFFNGHYEHYLTTLSPEQCKECYNINNPPQDKMINVGYVRKLPQWQNFVRQAVAKNKLVNSCDYFLYILSLDGKRSLYLDEPNVIELVKESLLVLKKYNNRIKTVLKPHAFTDVPRTEALLKKIGYTNYVIDYSHPMVLSSRAKFLFANIFSTTMVDAFYMGKPTVEYCSYDPKLLEIFKKVGYESFGGPMCDYFIYRDPQKLDKVLDCLINGNGSLEIKRDPEFLRQNFPDTSSEFYDFWKKII